MKELSYMLVPGIRRNKIGAKDLIDAFEAVTAFDFKALHSRSRKRPLVLVRHLFCFVANKCGFKPEAIGKMVDRERTTVYSAIEVAEDLLTTDAEFKELYQKVAKKLRLNYRQPLSKPVDISVAAKKQTERKFEPEIKPIVRPKAEYSNKQWL